jgi:hypothetical protein
MIQCYAMQSYGAHKEMAVNNFRRPSRGGYPTVFDLSNFGAEKSVAGKAIPKEVFDAYLITPGNRVKDEYWY